MKIELGKYYRDRNGDQERVVMQEVVAEGINEFPFPFVVQRTRDKHRYRVNRNGEMSRVKAHSKDLIAEWRDEPREIWVNVYEGGPAVRLHDTREMADRCAGRNRTECVLFREVLPSENRQTDAAESSNQPPIPDGWRVLEPDERVKEGDEHWSATCKSFIPSRNHLFPDREQGQFCCPYIRKED